MNNNELQEIQRSLGRLEGKVEEGFKGVYKRQDITNGNILHNSKRIKKIEECVDWKDVTTNARKIDKIEAFVNNLKGKIAVWVVILSCLVPLLIKYVPEIIKGLITN